MALADILGLKLNHGFGKKTEDVDSVENYTRMFEGNLGLHTQLAMPPFGTSLSEGDFTQNGKKGVQLNFNHGTTTLAFKYQGGVLAAVDSRATSGQFISSQDIEKVIRINKYIVGTLAGCAADCCYWERVLAERCRVYELRNRERISVAAASKLLANILYNYKGMGLSLGLMICGYDKKGPGLYYVDNDGNRFPGEMFCVGSGATYAFGVADSGYKFDMTDDEAAELGQRAIYHATYRDAGSGGKVRILHIKEDGFKISSITDCFDLHKKYQDEAMST